MDITITIADKDAATIFGKLKAGYGWDDATDEQAAANLADEVKKQIAVHVKRGQMFSDRVAAEASQVQAEALVADSVMVNVKV